MRHLITLSKFHQLKESTLPTLLSTASKSLEMNLEPDRDMLLEVIQSMDQLVFDEFIKKRSRKLVDVMEIGILRSGVDWLNAGKPTGRSSFFFFPLLPFLLFLFLMSFSSRFPYSPDRLFLQIKRTKQSHMTKRTELINRGPGLYAQNHPNAR